MQAEAVQKFAQLGRNIICIGRNYVAHAKELNNEVPKQPMWFLKPTSSYVQMPNPIIRPTTCQDFHYEVELGVIIGKGGKRIPVDQAMSHVGGYTLGIDMTCRDLQEVAKEKRLPWAESKGYDTFSAVGDFINVSKVTDPHNLSIWLKRNGDIKQDGNTKDMIFNIPKLISYLSGVMTLQPGDLILTGTPEGVGPVVPGDVVTCGIKELDLELSFPIVQEEI
jgi:acylpyruvate hydrolase